MNRLDVEEIEQILPHRHPFLLVDYIEDYEPGKFAVGYKCVTFREDFFTGTFSAGAGHAGSADCGGTGTDRCCGNLESRRKQGQDCLFWRNQKLPISTEKLFRETSCVWKQRLSNAKGPVGVGHAVASVDGKVVVECRTDFYDWMR